MSDLRQPRQQFRINRPAVVHETLDDELIVVNLDSGKYYSVDESGAAIWRLVESGVAVDVMVDALVAATSATRVTVSTAVVDFLAELEREALIVPAVAEASMNGHGNGNAPTVKPGPFRTPSFRVYTDMQDLLMLDPIHEVDETGWPSAPPPSRDRRE